MTDSIDIDTLEATSGPPIELLTREQISGNGATAALAGFSDLGRVHLAVHVKQAKGAPAITLLVEESADGMSWDTAATFSFTDLSEDRVGAASITSPKDQLRVSWTVSGQVIDKITASVTARPGVVAEASNGGSLPSQWTVGPDGELTIAATGGDASLSVHVPDDSTNPLRFYNDTWDPDPTDPVAVIGATDTGDLRVHMHSSGRFLALESSGGTVDIVSSVARFWAKTAPADEALESSTFALWLDATPGAAQLMVKAKDSNGAIVTAAIPLA